MYIYQFVVLCCLVITLPPGAHTLVTWMTPSNEIEPHFYYHSHSLCNMVSSYLFVAIAVRNITGVVHLVCDFDFPLKRCSIVITNDTHPVAPLTDCYKAGWNQLQPSLRLDLC